METTKSLRKIIDVIKEHNWLSVAEISQLTGIAEGHVRNSMKSRGFDKIVRGKRLQKQPNGVRYITVYQYPTESGKHTEQALKLAKKHQGMFGQLYWVTNESVETMV